MPGFTLDSLELDSLVADPTTPDEGESWYRSDQEQWKIEVSSGPQIVGRRDNLAATVSPTVSDDTTEEYSVGSRWFDTVADIGWRCFANFAAGAEWLPTSHTEMHDTGSTGLFSNTAYAAWASLSIALPVRGLYRLFAQSSVGLSQNNSSAFFSLSTPNAGSISTTPLAGTERVCKRGGSNQSIDRMGFTLMASDVPAEAGDLVGVLRRVSGGSGDPTACRMLAVLTGMKT